MRKHLVILLVLLSLVACNQKQVIIDSDYDVIIVGGGPAGIGAALAAAETGARTVLIERDSIIGGTTVQAEVCDIGLFYTWKKQIIAGPAWDLVVNAVEAAHGELPDFSKQEPDKWMESCVHVDPEVYSRVAKETLREAGVVLIMNNEVTSVERTADGWKIDSITGSQVIDATGNATIAALAGAERVKSPDSIRQPGSFFFWISSKGLDFDWEAVNRAQKEAIKDGELLPTDMPIGMSFFISKGGGSECYIPLADNSTPEARVETNQRGIEARDRVLAFIRRQKGLENVELESPANEVGVRETYRVVGEKTITEEDYLQGIVPDDALAWSYWMVDEHNAGKSARLVFLEENKVGTIPLGAMLPKGVGNMLVAGRAISSDQGANSAIRVQASCMAMGQAAGVVAALAASHHCDPRDVPLDLIRKCLTDIGHIVPKKDESTPLPSQR
jgi:hypothetical protein